MILKLALYALIVSLWAPALTSVGETNLNFALTGAVLIFALSANDKDKRNSGGALSESYPILLVTIAIFFWALISFIWAEKPFRVFRVAYGQLFAISIILYFQKFASRQLIDGTWKVFVFSALFSAFVAIGGAYIPALNALLFEPGRDRTAGLFKQANQLGIALSMGVPLAIAYAASLRKGFAPYLLLVAPLFLGLAMSGSKTNLVFGAASAILTVIWILTVNGTLRRSPHVAIFIVLGTIATMATAFAVLEIVNPRAYNILLRFSQGGEAQSIEVRNIIYASSFSDAMAHPLTGVGAGQFTSAYNVPHSHNVFLDFFRTLGVPGLALFSVQMLLFCRLALKALSNALTNSKIAIEIRILCGSLAIACFSYIASNQLSDSFGPSTSPLFWCCVAMLASLVEATSIRLSGPKFERSDL